MIYWLRTDSLDSFWPFWKFLFISVPTANENCSFVSSFQVPLFWTLLSAFLTMCYMFLSVCLFRFRCRIHCFRYRAWLLNTYPGLFRIASPVHLCPTRFYASLPCSLINASNLVSTYESPKFFLQSLMRHWHPRFSWPIHQQISHCFWIQPA